MVWLEHGVTVRPRPSLARTVPWAGPLPDGSDASSVDLRFEVAVLVSDRVRAVERIDRMDASIIPRAAASITRDQAIS